MKLDLNKKIVSFLKKHSDEKFTAHHIAEHIFETYPQECQAKLERSAVLKTDKDVIEQLKKEIHARRGQLPKDMIKMTEDRPRHYYYTKKTEQEEIETYQPKMISDDSDDTGYKEKPFNEHQLYPQITEFLWSELHLYPKHINDKRSSNKHGKNGNIWLYPDIVAMEDLTRYLDNHIKDCMTYHTDKKVKLWSFEVKTKINRSNLRESFFQAVSNSSWANYGYLIATELDESAKRELDILTASHGIGFILFNPTENEGHILIPAQERKNIDWETANRITQENPDFKSFITEVTDFYTTGKTKLSDWDIPKHYTE